jgi:hypothetical protein
MDAMKRGGGGYRSRRTKAISVEKNDVFFDVVLCLVTRHHHQHYCVNDVQASKQGTFALRFFLIFWTRAQSCVCDCGAKGAWASLPPPLLPPCGFKAALRMGHCTTIWLRLWSFNLPFN